MCGYLSVFSQNGQPIAKEILQDSLQMIHHRGPDDTDIYLDGAAALGFCRLSIIDLAHGRQPMSNEDDSLWITFNGEIYNFQELREWLLSKGHQFKTNADTETILHLYEEVGKDTPKYLRGMFSFVIWDRKKNAFFGARDHFGIKPLYYAKTCHGYAFGSEIKSILHLDPSLRKVKAQSYYHFLTFQYVPDPETMYQDIHKLPAGHSFYLTADTLKMEPYWQADFSPEQEKPFEYFVEEIRNTLQDSVKAHQIADVPVGAFLSGGIDSTTTVGLMSQFSQVKTFSVGFDMNGYSELDVARRTATFFGTDHHELDINYKEFMDELPKIVWHMDDPVADPAAFPLYFVARLASKQVKVVVSGEGADEFFGGYNIYREPTSLRMFSGLSKNTRGAIRTLSKLIPQGVKGRNYLMRGSKTVEERFFGNALIYDEISKQGILGEEMRGLEYQDPWSVTRPIYDRVQQHDDETKMQYLDIHTWLPGDILVKADKMTMAHSLELRVPFVDTKVFDLARRIPTKYKIANGTTKYVLREAMHRLVPKEIFSRKKLGFPVPIRVWLRNEIYDHAREILFDPAIKPFVNQDVVHQMLEDHKNGIADYSRKLWNIIIFSQWYRTFIIGSV
ncbi:asparagine synthase (glutamine-hydrolyzing) [Risungbinella massiliensis]|uniref:asparagine synthase (glutamine-hydrolyzing) n=1 Tax=Risungbinella massiliensis TaxID=1329796 RepID=UPI0005CBE367|nr:asparagine synthase (glutamine-hydrolyzing) [Risungbinella massiliensis]